MNIYFRYLSAFSFSVLLSVSCFAQHDNSSQSPLTHWMTPEELLRKDEIGRGFVPTPPPTGPVTSVPEFLPSEGVLVRYPFGIPMLLIKELSFRTKVTTIVKNSSQQSTVTSQYTSNGVNLANCEFMLANTDSYWTRDYGPWYIIDSSYTVGIVDFPYNRPRPNDDEIAKLVAQHQGIEWFGMNVIHTGGNYMSAGMGQAASTELVYEENPSTPEAVVHERMKDYLGIDPYFVRPDPNNTYIDHIDCWSKFLDVDKILVRAVPPTHPQYNAIEQAAAWWSSTISSYGTPYQVFRVNTPNDEPYGNSLILNKTVYVPVMGNANDLPAKAVYQAAMPGYEILTFTALSSAPWEGTDALHCRTHEMADRGMLLIKHMPILTSRPADEDYGLLADVVALSKQGFYSDSVFVAYRVNSGTWQHINMSRQALHQWSATIPRQTEGSVVDYYIHAADSSGRSENHPYIGAYDPHRFTVGPAIHPHLAINTTAIDTFAFPGTSTWATLSLTNTGAAPLSYTLTAEPAGSWMVIPEPQGTISVGTVANVQVELNSSGMENGVYHGFVKIVSNDPDRLMDSVAVTFAVGDPAGLTPLRANGLTVLVSPNPFNDLMQLTIQSETGGEILAAIYTASGQPVWRANLTAEPGVNRYQVQGADIQKLKSGVFLLSVTDATGTVFRRILKMN